MENQTKNNNLIPVAIIVAGLLVAGAVMFSGQGGDRVATNTEPNQPAQVQPTPTGSTDDVNPVTAEDHIKGNPNAPVKIVEYSYFECPFCKRFHVTMNQVMDEYGA